MQLKSLSKLEILELIKDDFTRECREIYAYAFYAEDITDDPILAEEIAERGQQAILHSVELGEIILNLGGELPGEIDEEAAIREAGLVAQSDWTRETTRRLRERASHLILLDEVGLSIRLFRILNEKRALPSLDTMLHSDERVLLGLAMESPEY